MHRNTLTWLLTAAIAIDCSTWIAQAAPGPHEQARAFTPRVKPDDTDVDEPKGVVTYRDALALALVRHPELSVFPYELRAAEARALQAALRPNPELEIEVEEFGGRDERSGFDAAETTIQIGQPIELAGKRAKRRRLASLDGELVQWDYESARLDVVREVARAFAAVLAAQDRVALRQGLFELSRQAHAAVAQRVEAGRDSPVDELRASVALSQSHIELQKAQKALTTARHALAATWGGRAPAFEKAAGEFYEVAPPVALETAAAAAGRNPDLARWETQEDRQRAALRLEKARAVPDLVIGGGVRRFEETDDSALVFGLAVPIPLFDRNQGSIREAIAELAKVRRQSEAVQVRTLAALAEAVDTLAAAYDEVNTLHSDVLPKAEEAFAAAEEGYRQGKFDYLYVLDTQRTLFEARAQYIDAAEAYHRARADVERLSGRPLNDADEDAAIPIREPSLRENSNEK